MKQVENVVASYVAAFNSRDADKLASHWSAEGVYTNSVTGEQSVGRAAIAAEFKTIFAEPNVPKLAVATESIQLVSPNVALEKGTATVTYSADEVVETSYSVVYTRQNGQWLIDRVTEETSQSERTHYDKLQQLEWMIGEWSLESDRYMVELNSNWTTNQNFIVRKFKVTAEQTVESSGLQIIGWDAKDKIIRSWLFDSDGGFVNGKWTPKDDGWSVQSVATLADGSIGSYTTLFRNIDNESYGWRKVNQIVDSELLPNLDEVIFRRD